MTPVKQLPTKPPDATRNTIGGSAHCLVHGERWATSLELLTLPQVAKLCGFRPRTVWGWATAGVATAHPRISKVWVEHSKEGERDEV